MPPCSPVSTLLCSPPTPCPHRPPLRFPLPVAYLDADACSMPRGPTTRAPAHASCVGDNSPALRQTGMCRGEARASQVPGSSSSCVLWSDTPPDTIPSSPTSRRGRCGLRWNPALSASGKTIGFGAAVPRPARSHAYASSALFPRPTPGLLPARAGSPLAGRASHPLDDKQSFMKASPPPIPFDQHCLVALNFLSDFASIKRLSCVSSVCQHPLKS